MTSIATLTYFMLAILASTATAHTPGTIQVANENEQRGIMNHVQFLKLDDITDKIEAGGTVTDSDLDYAFQLLKAKAPNPKEETFRHFLIVSHIAEYTRWTPHQKDELFKEALWLMHLPTPSAKDVYVPDANKSAVIFLLEDVDDQRTIPYLHSLESDPDPEIADLAKRAFNGVTRDVSHAATKKHSSSPRE